MSEYFPKPESLGANVKVELDLPKKTNLANLKSDVNKWLIDKLKKWTK